MTRAIAATFGRALVASAALTSTSCALNPATGQRQFSLMSESQEIAIGQEMDGQIRREMGIYDDKALQEYVASVGHRLARGSERPNLPWHFAIVDSPAINAFALPGGYIYLTRGIMPFLGDEAELAGVLGHEIGHVTARHAAQQYSRATGAQLGLVLGSIFVPGIQQAAGLAESGLGLLFLKYGRDDELQSDALGARYAARAGWSPSGVAGMLSTLDRVSETSEDRRGVPNWLATHPSPADRVERVQAAIKEAEAEAHEVRPVDRDAYLRRLDGLVYGDNPDQGVTRGSQFLHRALRFAIDFPKGWEINNSATQVVAKRPGMNVFLLLQLVQKPQGRNAEDIARIDMGSAGFRLIQGSRTAINGLEAFVGTYEGTIADLGRVGMRAAHILYGSNVFLFTGIAPVDGYQRVQAELNDGLRAFRPLSAAEAERIQPNRIDLYTARAGDTWQAIADRQAKGIVRPETLAVMNGRTAAEPPRSGERLKIVVAG
jgi:predicted Zn-dependent protease